MKKAILFLLAIVFAVAYSQLCKVSSIDSNYKSLLQQLNKFDNIFDDVSVISIALSHVGLASELAQCQVLAATFVQSVGVENSTIITTHCPFPKTDSRWTNDPCCNPNLRFSQCCVPRPIVVPKPVITAFNNNIQSKCKNPDLARAVIRHVQRNYDNRDAFCENVYTKAAQDVANMVNGFGQCFTDFLNKKKPCTQNSDCPSNFCDTDTYQCSASYYDSDPAPLAQCLVNNIPPYAIRAFALFNNYTQVSIAVSDLTALIQRVLFKEYCVSNSGAPNLLLKTKAECESLKICTDNVPFACANSNSFCGLLCQPNKPCQSNVGALVPLLNSQATCNSLGSCTGKDANGNDVSTYINSTDCSSQQFCTIKSCYPSCTQQKCESQGICVGWPAAPGQGVCITPFNSMTEGTAATCPTNFDNVGIGCYSSAITDSASCTAAKGTFYNYPADKNACESYTICREANAVASLKSAAECQKCNGKIMSPFKWINGVWRNRIFKQITSWTPRTLVTQFKWVSGIDYVNFASFVLNTVRVISYPLIKSRYLCSVEPLVAATRMIACDCGAEQGTGCFDKYKVGSSIVFDSKIGNFRAVANANTSYSFADVSITASSGSVATSIDNANVEITKSDLVVSTTAARSLKQYSTTVSVVDSSNNAVGQVVGNGIAVSVAFPAGVSICIPISDQVSVNSKYTKAGFAIKNSAGSYVYTSVTITSTSNGQICGTVSDTQTYYPAYVEASTQPQNPSKNSAAIVSVFNAFVVAVIAFIIFVL